MKGGQGGGGNFPPPTFWQNIRHRRWWGCITTYAPVLRESFSNTTEPKEICSNLVFCVNLGLLALSSNESAKKDKHCSF